MPPDTSARAPEVKMHPSAVALLVLNETEVKPRAPEPREKEGSDSCESSSGWIGITTAEPGALPLAPSGPHG